MNTTDNSKNNQNNANNANNANNPLNVLYYENRELIIFFHPLTNFITAI